MQYSSTSGRPFPGVEDRASALQRASHTHPGAWLRPIGDHDLDHRMRPIAGTEVAAFPVRVDRAHEIEVLDIAAAGLPFSGARLLPWAGRGQQPRADSRLRLVGRPLSGGYGSETGPLAVSVYWIAVCVLTVPPGWSLDGHLPLTSAYTARKLKLILPEPLIP